MKTIKLSILLCLFGVAQGNLLYETDYHYSELNEIQTLQNNSLSTSSALSIFKYRYDQNGNVTSILKTYPDRLSYHSQYSYDAQSRLIQETEPNGTTTYVFDLQSNIRQEITPTGTLTRLYSNRNQLMNIMGLMSQDDFSFSYDSFGSGNLSSDSHHTYYYDALNELTNYSNESYYRYDANGERLNKSGTSGAQSFYYQGISLVNSQDLDQHALTSYLFGLNREAYIDNNQPQFYQTNLHHDVIQLTNAVGNITENYDYDVYGNPTLKSSQDNNPYRYARYFYDPESGLYYLNARYYDPDTEIFISEDSLVGGNAGYNRYLYVNGDPVMGVDPSGHGFESIPSEVLRMVLEHMSPRQRAAVSRVHELWAFWVILLHLNFLIL